MYDDYNDMNGTYKESYCLCNNKLLTEHELEIGECSECSKLSVGDGEVRELNFD